MCGSFCGVLPPEGVSGGEAALVSAYFIAQLPGVGAADAVVEQFGGVLGHCVLWPLRCEDTCCPLSIFLLLGGMWGDSVACRNGRCVLCWGQRDGGLPRRVDGSLCFEISVGENVCEEQRSEDAFPITSVVMDGVVCGSVGEGRSVDELPVDGGEVLSTVNNRNLRQLGDAGGSWVCECGILVQVF